MTIQIERGLSVHDELDTRAVTRALERSGCRVLELPAHGIVDRASLFDAVRSSLPLDPPVVGSRSWDALSDSLWEGLRQLDASRIAIVWPNAGALQARASPDFDAAVSVLSDVAATLEDARATLGHPKRLSIVVGLRETAAGTF